MTDFKLWTVDELASFLNCRKRLIYGLTSDERIPFYKVGRELRFDPKEVREHFRLQRQRRAKHPNIDIRASLNGLSA